MRKYVKIQTTHSRIYLHILVTVTVLGFFFWFGFVLFVFKSKLRNLTNELFVKH